jgi:hypothetical protein
MKLMHAVLCAALIAAPLAACGGGAAPVEARVEESRLKEFAVFLPAAPAGWTAGGAKLATGDEKSSVTQAYTTPAGESFSVEIVFSNAEASKFQELIDDQKKRTRAGADVADINGREGLTFKTRAVTNAQYVVVATPSRTVSITPLFGDMIKPVMRAVFDTIDFEAIASK